MKGFRQQTANSRKERLRSMEAELKNSQMAGRISQMMLQQIMNNMRAMQEDLGRAFGIVTELQYKILAIQKVSGLDLAQMNEVANAQRLADFEEASANEDKEGGYTVGDVVNEASTVILTSTTEEKDRGIFRSRLKLSECGVPDLIKAFMGREVGAGAIVKLNGIDHTVTLLGVRQPLPGAPADAAGEVPAAVAGSGFEQVPASDDASQPEGSEVVGNA